MRDEKRSNVDEAFRPSLLATYGKLPLSFEANRGQTDSKVKFLSRGKGYTLFLTPTGAVLTFKKADTESGVEAEAGVKPGDDGGVKKQQETQQSVVGFIKGPKHEQGYHGFKGYQGREGTKETSTVLSIQLIGANPSSEVTGLDELPGRSNYFIGNEPGKWQTNIPRYARVKYAGVYPGIDLVFYGNQRQLEYDFVVAPGADHRAIQLRFEGADELGLDDEGNLILHVNDGEVILKAPTVYQKYNGKRQIIPGSYVLSGSKQVSFRVAQYDADKPLVIDPVLAYSTYLGGSFTDWAEGITVDAFGNVFIMGTTASIDFPQTAGAYQTSYAGGVWDVFVTKIDSSGTSIVYSTYLGGSSDDLSISIAVDAAGNAYVTGGTWSTDFPTVNPIQSIHGGEVDAFVTKLNSTGSALVYSTFLGGSNFDRPGGIAVDGSGNAYVTGMTQSTDFPVVGTSGVSWQPENAGSTDAFLLKIGAAGSSILYGGYLGGSHGDYGEAIALDDGGNAYITGFTDSTDFPTTSGAFQPECRCVGWNASDAFVTKIDSSGALIGYSTYLGGDGNENQFVFTGIAVDDQGNIYVTGDTNSEDFPTTEGAFQTQFLGGTDAFVTKLRPAGVPGNDLVYSTYLGGTAADQGRGIAVGPGGSVYVAGTTYSNDFPTEDPIQAIYGGNVGNIDGGDVFVTLLNSTGSGLLYSTYLGGNGDDAGHDIAVDAAGNVYVTGQTNSGDFPTTAGVFQSSFAGGWADTFVAKIGGGADFVTADLSVSNIDNRDPAPVGQNFSYLVSVINNGPDTAIGVILTNTITGGFSFVSAATNRGSCSETGGAVTCNIGTMTTSDVVTVTIVLTPSAAGTITNTAAVSSASTDLYSTNDTATEDTTTDFSDISVSPTSHDFGSLIVGSSSTPQTLTVSNIGAAYLMIGMPYMAGIDASQFVILNENCFGQTLETSGNCTVEVVFSPTSEGPKSANLSIPSNDPDTPTLDVQLNGTGEICLKGEINNDSEINILDVILVLRIVLGFDQLPVNLCAVDIDNSEVVDISDVIKILRLSL